MCVLVIVVEVNMVMNFCKLIEEMLYKVDGFLVYVILGDGVVVFILGLDFVVFECLIFEFYWLI